LDTPPTGVHRWHYRIRHARRHGERPLRGVPRLCEPCQTPNAFQRDGTRQCAALSTPHGRHGGRPLHFAGVLRPV